MKVQKKRGRKSSKELNKNLNPETATKPGKAGSFDVTDPNFISYFSSCIKEVHKEGYIRPKSFSERIRDSAKYIESLSEERRDGVQRFLGMIKTQLNQAEMHSAMGNAAGKKIIRLITTKEHLYAYMALFNPSMQDVTNLCMYKKGQVELTSLAMVTAFGIWYRVMESLQGEGEVISDDQRTLMNKLNSLFGGKKSDGSPKSESFYSGVNLANRIISGFVPTERRGRRPKNYFEQFSNISAGQNASASGE